MKQLNILLSVLNTTYTKVGSFSILPDEDVKNNSENYQPGDIGVYYDYCTDELSNTEGNEFATWVYDVAWSAVGKLMSSMGYVEVENQDGSGGGLYYGMVAYRKI